MSNTDENATTAKVEGHWTGIICLGEKVKDAIRKEVRDAIAKELKLDDASDLPGNLERYVGQEAKASIKELLDSRDAEIARIKSEVKRLNVLFKKVEECRQNIIYCKRHPEDAYGIPNDYRADTFNQWMNRLKEVIDSSKEESAS
jgi:hypothetical protein